MTEKKFLPYIEKCQIYYASCQNPADTLIMETYLINKYKPLLNTSMKYDNKLDYNIPEPVWILYKRDSESILGNYYCDNFNEFTDNNLYKYHLLLLASLSYYYNYEATFRIGDYPKSIKQSEPFSICLYHSDFKRNNFLFTNNIEDYTISMKMKKQHSHQWLALHFYESKAEKIYFHTRREKLGKQAISRRNRIFRYQLNEIRKEEKINDLLLHLNQLILQRYNNDDIYTKGLFISSNRDIFFTNAQLIEFLKATGETQQSAKTSTSKIKKRYKMSMLTYKGFNKYIINIIQYLNEIELKQDF